jgi:hypothetical protein
MSPATTAVRDPNGDRSVPRPLPAPAAELLLLTLSREIVVDWQLPSDHDRQN